MPPIDDATPPRLDRAPSALLSESRALRSRLDALLDQQARLRERLLEPMGELARDSHRILLALRGRMEGHAKLLEAYQGYLTGFAGRATPPSVVPPNMLAEVRQTVVKAERYLERLRGQVGSLTASSAELGGDEAAAGRAGEGRPDAGLSRQLAEMCGDDAETVRLLGQLLTAAASFPRVGVREVLQMLLDEVEPLRQAWERELERTQRLQQRARKALDER